MRRSNALQGWAYGRAFRYRELAGYGRGTKAPDHRDRRDRRCSAGCWPACSGRRPRGLVDRLLPSPGEGPSAEKRAAGFFRMRVRSTTTSGCDYVATVAAQGRSGLRGYRGDARRERAGLADGSGLPAAAGVLTPATALGDALVARLRAVGLTLSVERKGD